MAPVHHLKIIDQWNLKNMEIMIDEISKNTIVSVLIADIYYNDTVSTYK
jgi:predicted metal-dependent TIM-barrel fold hydrolase